MNSSYKCGKEIGELWLLIASVVVVVLFAAAGAVIAIVVIAGFLGNR